MFKLRNWLATAALVIVLDQTSKYSILQHFKWGEALTVTPDFDLVCAHNTGAAFSLFDNQPGWQRGFFITIASFSSLFIVYLLQRNQGNNWSKFALSLILGGALGNLIDRITHGFVVDFLLFHIGAYAWPAFNLADSAIFLGAVIFIWDGLHTKSGR